MQCNKDIVDSEVFPDAVRESTEARTFILKFFDNIKDVDHYFEKFSYLWLAFDCWMKTVVSISSLIPTEMHYIHSLSNDKGLDDTFRMLLENDECDSFKEDVELFTQMLPVFDARIIRFISSQGGSAFKPKMMDTQQSNMQSFIEERRLLTDYYFNHLSYSHTVRYRDEPIYEREMPTHYPKCWRLHTEELEQQRYTYDWYHTLMAIYQIRCNLFHGYKGRSIESDRVLVEYAYRCCIACLRDVLRSGDRFSNKEKKVDSFFL